MHRTIVTADDIDRIIANITREIIKAHNGVTNLALIGIHTRGVYLARRVKKKIDKIEKIEIPTGSMDINLYRDDWTRLHHHPIVQATEIPFSVDGKKIVLVDDVLFTGRTIRAAMDALVDFGRPERIELVVLVDRGHRELPIQADYVGKVIKTSHSDMVNVLLSEVDGEDKIVID